MATTIPTVPEATHTPPNRGQSQEDFNSNMSDAFEFEHDLPTNMNAAIDPMNTLGQETEYNAATATTKADEATTASGIAVAARNDAATSAASAAASESVVVDLVVSVKEFGAIGDGVTDDLAAFNSAGNSKSNIVVSVPAGDWLLSAQPSPTGKVVWDIDAGATFPGETIAATNTQKILSSNFKSIESDPTYHEGIFQYLEGNSALTGYGNLGLHGSAKSSWRSGAGTSGADIGISGFASNNKLNHSGGAWAIYGTAVREDGCYNTHAMELDIANLGNTVSLFPNSPFSTGQTHGIWLGSGGEISETSDAPDLGTASVAIGIISNDPNQVANFDKGIMFHSKAISGTDGATGSGVALAMATGHTQSWFNNSNEKVGEVRCTNRAGTNKQRVDFSAFGLIIEDINGGTAQFQVENVASAANKLNVRAATSGGAPSLLVTGSDADIDLNLVTKGSGKVRFGYGSTTAADAANFSADRYLEVKDGAGGTLYIPLMTSAW